MLIGLPDLLFAEIQGSYTSLKNPVRVLIRFLKRTRDSCPTGTRTVGPGILPLYARNHVPGNALQAGIALSNGLF